MTGSRISRVLNSTFLRDSVDPVKVVAVVNAEEAAGSTKYGLLARIVSFGDLLSKVGEVQSSPTANTLLDRLKAIATALAGTLTVKGQLLLASATLTKSAKTTAYALGQIIAQSATAGSNTAVALAAARAADASGMIRRVRMKVNDASWLNATVRVHFFKDAPTFSNGDAANFAGGLSESNYLGYVDVTLDLSFSGPVVKGIGMPGSGFEINFEPSAGTANIFYVLECRSTSAGSHSSGATFTVVAETFPN